MARFRVALSAEEFKDAEADAARRLITMEECVAGRLHGKAASHTKKRVGPAHLTIKAKSAYAEYDELPDAEHQFDMSAGSLRNAVTSVAADAPVKIVWGDEELPVLHARIVVDDGVLTIDLTPPSNERVSDVSDFRVPATPVDPDDQLAAINAAQAANAIPEGHDVGGES